MKTILVYIFGENCKKTAEPI